MIAVSPEFIDPNGGSAWETKQPQEEEFEMTDVGSTVTACNAQNFNAVDSNKWSCMKNRVRDKFGITINTDSGTAGQGDFTVAWNYNSIAQTLSVQCTRSPSSATCSVINDQVQRIARSCGV
jgi:hypothetical protein